MKNLQPLVGLRQSQARLMVGAASAIMCNLYSVTTNQDETGIANLIGWPALVDKQRRTILGAQMMACRGRVQRATGVIHLIAEHLIDQSEMLRRISGKDEAFILPAGRGDEARTGGHGGDPRDKALPLRKVRDIYVPDLHIDTLAVKARNFR